MSRSGQNIEVRHLRYFTAVVEAGSFHRASARLGVSQPTLTRQVHSLEHALGVSLLVRMARGIKPTEAGRVLFEDASRILARLDVIFEHVRHNG